MQEVEGSAPWPVTPGLPLCPQEEAFATRSPGYSRLGVFLFLFFCFFSSLPTPHSFFISEHSGRDPAEGRAEGRCSPHACRVRKAGSEGALGGPVSAVQPQALQPQALLQPWLEHAWTELELQAVTSLQAGNEPTQTSLKACGKETVLELTVL